MKTCFYVFIVVLAIVGFGCVIHVEPPNEYDEYPAERINSNFDARIESAKSITSFTSQDKALSSIAIDAANALEVKYTINALSMMTQFTVKDSTAEHCVTPFINENMLEEARSIANQITTFTTKDRVLARIAHGPEDSN
jgi:hypothetical protein